MTEDWELCDSCEEGVDPAGAFFEEGKFYHPDCVQMHRCIQCGSWIDNGKICPEDGEAE